VSVINRAFGVRVKITKSPLSSSIGAGFRNSVANAAGVLGHFGDLTNRLWMLRAFQQCIPAAGPVRSINPWLSSS
jgi:hypothetical protein